MPTLPLSERKVENKIMLPAEKGSIMRQELEFFFVQKWFTQDNNKNRVLSDLFPFIPFMYIVYSTVGV
jgi:hypothetical protein